MLDALILLAIALCWIKHDFVQAAQRQFSIEPEPPWVEAIDNAYLQLETKAESDPVVCLINDHQVRVTGGLLERYCRRANKIMNAGGLDDSSQLEFEFEPSYQKLVIHYLRIKRGDQIINVLRPDEIKVVQKETELDQRIYNGTLSAVVFINDVRVGDIVDYAYSISGSNPVLRGLYADSYLLASRVPTQFVRWRLLWPQDRRLSYKAKNTETAPAVKTLGSQTEYTWKHTNVAPVEFEDSTPSWFTPLPVVQLSEFPDWTAVVNWAVPLYRIQQPLESGLQAKINELRKNSDREQLFLDALKFVQDEIRYTGIELGPYSHTPTQPNIVFARRFGDCKDKSLLLCTILSELGFSASPALVDTEDRSTIDEDQPSPFDFNHVIVRAAIDDRVYWFDPTVRLQRGSLAQHTNAEFGRALVIQPGVTDVEQMPTIESGDTTISIKEIYNAVSYSAPCFLDVVTTYKAADADGMRYQLSQQSVTELGKTYLNYYAQLDPSVQSMGGIDVQDNERENTVRITERYMIPDFWRNQRREFYAGAISERLGKLPAANRKSPLALNGPLNLSQVIEAHLPEHYDIDGGSGTISTNQMSFRHSFMSAGSTLTLSYQLRQMSDYVPVAELSKHSDAVARIQKLLGYEINRGAAAMDWKPGDATKLLPLLVIVAPFAVFGAIKLFRRYRATERRNEYVRGLRRSRGEGPELAIPVKSSDEFPAHLLAFRCSCGTGFNACDLPTGQSSIIFDGKRISIVSMRCTRCQVSKDVYFILS